MRRRHIAEATAYKNAMVAGLMANTNLDDGKQTRQNILMDIEAKHLDSIAMIYNGKSDEELDYEQDPFFAAIDVERTPESVNTTDTSDLDQFQE